MRYVLVPRQKRFYIDLVDIYAPRLSVSDANTGEVPDASYVLLASGIKCYRQTAKEKKEVSVIGQSLEQAGLFTMDLFHFALGVDVASNYFLLFKSLLKTGARHPDYGMWFAVQGIPQPLTFRNSNTLQVLAKKDLKPLGV